MDDVSASEADDTSVYTTRDVSRESAPHLSARDINIVMQEREIFLRAILQLLDQRDTALDASRTARKTRDTSSNADILKSGPLKKCSGHSIHLWKEKYVELTYGMFAYEDDIGWGESHRKKNIPLTVDKCRCRAIDSGSAEGSWLFELSVTNGRERLWMSYSESERDAWVQAINTAILGSAGDFNIDDDNPTEPIKSGHNSKLLSTPHLQQEFIPYTEEIERYKTIKLSMSQTSTVHEYRHKIADMSPSNLTVPVFYIKELFHESDPMRTRGRLARTSKLSSPMHNSERIATAASNRAILSAQVWKDLPRDVICVNGDVITGDRGPEAMVGAIVRHVMEQAGKIREELVACGEGRFDLTEGDALSCVRDVLLACNRTESGGDSYLCVNALLGNPEIVVLTPWDASESEPMQIRIDTVKASKRDLTKRDSSVSLDSSVPDAAEDDREVGSDAAMSELNLDETVQSPLLAVAQVFSTTTSHPTKTNSSNRSGMSTPVSSLGMSAIFPDMTSDSDPPTSTVLDNPPTYSRSTRDSNAMPAILEITERSTTATGTGTGTGTGRNTPIGRNGSGRVTPLVTTGLSSPRGSGLGFVLGEKASPAAGRRSADMSWMTDEYKSMDGQTIIHSQKLPPLKPAFERNASPSSGKTKKHKQSKSTPESFFMQDGPPEDDFSPYSDSAPVRKRSGSEAGQSTTAPLPDDSKRSATNPRRHFWSMFSQSSARVKDEVVQIDRDRDKKRNVFHLPFSQRHVKSVDASPLDASRNSIVGLNKGNWLSSTPCGGEDDILRRHSSTDSPTTMSTRKSFVESIRDARQSRFQRSLDGTGKTDLFPIPPSMCIRIQVRVKSRYRLCAADPQDEDADTWGSVTGCLHQLFYIKSNCKGRSAVSDRLVTVVIGDRGQEFALDVHRDRFSMPSRNTSKRNNSMK